MSTPRLLLIAAMVAVAVFLLRDFLGNDRNFDERRAYWEQQLPTLGATPDKAALQAFAQANGMQLECTSNLNLEKRCTIHDTLSRGGSGSHPMQLSVFFQMKDDVAVSHSIETVPAPKR